MIKIKTDKHNLFDQICSSENKSDYLVMQLLWAYIQYAWKVKKHCGSESCRGNSRSSGALLSIEQSGAVIDILSTGFPNV